MKKNLLFVLLTLLITFINCDKDIEFETSFPFEIQENHRETVTINVGERTIFEIKPEKIVSVNKYEFKYVITKGGGYYTDDSAINIEEDVWYPLAELNFNFNFVGTIEGEVTAEVSIRDSERMNTVDVNYMIQQNPYNVELNTISNSATINEVKEFTLIITNTGDDETVTYSASLFISQGSGSVNLLDTDGNIVQVIDQNETFEILPGTYNYSAVFSDDGQNILNVAVTDSNGQNSTQTLEFSVDVIDFTFTGEPSKNTTTIGSEIDINFNLKELDGGDSDYQMRYILVDGDANIYYNGQEVSAGTNIDVSLGAYSLQFQPTEIGDVNLKFVAVNNTNVTKEVNIRIDVTDRTFDFTATRSLASLPLGESVLINYVITEDGGSEEDTYIMTYSTSNNGILIVDGTEYFPGTPIVLSSLNFSAIYEGSEAGEHTIQSTIVSQSNGETKVQSVDIEYLPSEFTFDVNTNTELTVGEHLDIEFILNETIGQSDFDIKYTITGVEQVFKNQDNVSLTTNFDYDTPSNTFIWTLEAIEQGEMTVNFTVTNQFGISESKVITYTILPIDFDFTVSPVGTVFDLDIPISIKFNMDAPSVLTYELSFTANTGGFVNYNGRSLDEGIENNISIPDSNFNTTYKSSFPGNSIINFTITASNGVAKTRTVNFNIKQKPKITSLTRRHPGAGASCGPGFNREFYYFTWTKDPSVAIVSVHLTVKGNVYNKTFSPLLSGSNNDSQGLEINCSDILARSASAFIVDSDGKSSTIYIQNF